MPEIEKRQHQKLYNLTIQMNQKKEKRIIWGEPNMCVCTEKVKLHLLIDWMYFHLFAMTVVKIEQL